MLEWAGSVGGHRHHHCCYSMGPQGCVANCCIRVCCVREGVWWETFLASKLGRLSKDEFCRGQWWNGWEMQEGLLSLLLLFSGATGVCCVINIWRSVESRNGFCKYIETCLRKEDQLSD